MLGDGHLHLDKTLFTFMKEHHIQGIANASHPQEYETICSYQHEYQYISISAGIHPWNVEEVSFKQMQPILEKVKIIGEIGLDSVWCKSDMNKQYEVFEKQLDFACIHKKPVILHLKGMEKEALDFIKKYPNTYLVHWHSTMECIQDYIDLDCYFTIGPSVNQDRAVKEVAKRIPMNRMLIETDGIGALSWCEEKEVDVNDYEKYLRRSIHVISKIRDIEEDELERIIEENYHRFISI